MSNTNVVYLPYLDELAYPPDHYEYLRLWHRCRGWESAPARVPSDPEAVADFYRRRAEGIEQRIRTEPLLALADLRQNSGRAGA